MNGWLKQNASVVITQVVGVGAMAFIAVMVSRQLEGYVTEKAWAVQNVRIETRLDKVEKVAEEARQERNTFQREALERLIRIEERLAAHVQSQSVKP